MNGPIRPGDPYIKIISIANSTGGASYVDTGGGPIAEFVHNGVPDTITSLTVGSISGTVKGYSISGSMGATSAGYAAGDFVDTLLTCTINGIVVSSVIDSNRLVQWPTTVLPNVASGASNGILLSNNGHSLTLDSSGNVTANSVTGNVGGSITGNIGGSLAGNVGGSVLGSVASVTNPVAANSLSASVLTQIAAVSVAGVANPVVASTVTGGVAGNVGGNVVGSVASVTNSVVASNVPSHFTNGTFASDGVFAPAALANTPATGGGITLSTVLNTPRALDSVADGSLTVNDALFSAIVAGVGGSSVNGASNTLMTPSTKTVIRTRTVSPASTITASAT